MRNTYPSIRQIKKILKKNNITTYSEHQKNIVFSIDSHGGSINNVFKINSYLEHIKNSNKIEFFVKDHLNDSLNSHIRWLKMYDPIMYENEFLNKPVFPNVELRELTPDEIANHKPKGRFQFRSEERNKESNTFFVNRSDIKSMPNGPTGDT